jgi:hypothetical protein
MIHTPFREKILLIQISLHRKERWNLLEILFALRSSLCMLTLTGKLPDATAGFRSKHKTKH